MSSFTWLANAISQVENSTWPNNPGALKDSAGNKLDFGSPESGYQALLDKLSFDASGQSKVYSPNMSLQDFENTYTGGDTNAASTLGKLLGVPTSTPLGSLSDQALGNAPLNPDGSLNRSANPFDPNSPLSSSNSGASSIGSIGGGMLASLFGVNSVAILAGLVLIAGAVFGFRTLGNVTVNVAKKGAEVAAA